MEIEIRIKSPYFCPEIFFMNAAGSINILRASEHNLKSVTLSFPKNKLVVVTGVSGSGKSSLVFDVLYREAESRYLGSLSAHARQFLGKMKRPEVGDIEGLSAAIAVKQMSGTGNQRSTVGTLTGMYDYLRLLYARIGKTGVSGMESPSSPSLTGFKEHAGEPVTEKFERGLFSFNSPAGACPHCKGLGVEDRIWPGLLIADPGKTLRQGALSITTPNGYIIYSQVTMEALDQVCRAEGFHVDIPWKELTPEQQHIVLYGSEKIEIPYGKHPLESRMRWSGITAKPREMGYYKGIVPVMENILQHDRNKNILRFVRTTVCPVCNGARLNEKALSVMVKGHSIASLCALPLDGLQKVMERWDFDTHEQSIAGPILSKISAYVHLSGQLGLQHLSLGRETATLSGGELQRLRLSSQAMAGLSGLLYVFDEPSIGLHPGQVPGLIEILKTLRDKGNTVVVVEHDDLFVRHADWLIDIGPGPGGHGGEVLINSAVGNLSGLLPEIIEKSKTLEFLTRAPQDEYRYLKGRGNGYIEMTGVSENNLKNIDVRFHLETLNVVTGVTGAGKSTLVNQVLGNFLRNKIQGLNEKQGKFSAIAGWEAIGKVLGVDQTPIGRTPRSNPATYTGLFDQIRDLFASLPGSKAMGFDKSRFSFNTAGGRCEACQGAGYRQIGMHFMGNVEIVCESCNGQRFDPDTLSIRYRGKNIFEILEMDVDSASSFFTGDLRILTYLETLKHLGLGYLTLGQRSSTLSGGEAQRIKLATELSKPRSAHTLYLLDEPTTGLHPSDIAVLLKALDQLVENGHTIVMIEHDPAIIRAAGHVVDLGPGSGQDGGKVVFSGTPRELIKCTGSATARALAGYEKMHDGKHNKNLFISDNKNPFTNPLPGTHETITLKGVKTHNLKNIDVKIPVNKITVVTGVSGSGKSSLAFDTLFAEGQNRFLESFSTYFRSRVGMEEKALFDEISGLTATFAVNQQQAASNPRSTVGTMTGIYDHYRLLYSRIGSCDAPESGTLQTISGNGSPASQAPSHPPSSGIFSFNHQLGACSSCNGLGFMTTCDPLKLISHPEVPITQGAMDGTKTGKFYGDPHGQYMATLRAVGEKYGIDYDIPWDQLGEKAKKLALEGSGEERYQVHWGYKRGQRTGSHHFEGSWPGLLALVQDEYERKHADRRGESMMGLMKSEKCAECHGARLKKEMLQWTVDGLNIARLSELPVSGAMAFFQQLLGKFLKMHGEAVAIPLVREILHRMEVLTALGLSYLSMDRISSTLSGGEARRVKLAGQLGSGLTGLTYILDEPTIGLHPRDTKKMMKVVLALQEKGNTILIVEHDESVILAADHIVELGPGAGKQGGLLVAQGTPDEIIRDPRSVTGPWLGKKPALPLSGKRELKPGLFIRNAFANNLKGFDLNIPSGGLIAITGVSGSGKSTLLFEVVLASYENQVATGCSALEGFHRFHKVVALHPRSGFSAPAGTPATFTGIFDPIRGLMAATPDARQLQFGKNHFSYLSKEGRCPVCQGMGKINIPMDFLADVSLECETCHGTRYRDEIRRCKYRGHSVDEILGMTFSEARLFFNDHKTLAPMLKLVEKVGLGYLQLGQSLDTLSGGESQRLTLIAELLKPAKGPTLYLFEEPSTGLHFSDIQYLLKLFHQLADQGNTLLIIEHDKNIISQTDWSIELGPEGGPQGGYLIRESQ